MQSGVSEVIYFVEKRIDNSDYVYVASHKLLSMAGVKVCRIDLYEYGYTVLEWVTYVLMLHGRLGNTNHRCHKYQSSFRSLETVSLQWTQQVYLADLIFVCCLLIYIYLYCAVMCKISVDHGIKEQMLVSHSTSSIAITSGVLLTVLL